MIDDIKKDQFIMTRNIMKLEKDIKKTQKQLRRLQPKVQKAANNYNRITKEFEKGQHIIKAMARKRDELVEEFMLLTKSKEVK
jgi:flagellar biosynthesis chaperone FliJ